LRTNGSSLASAIREEARRLGFFKAGIARARPLPGSQRFDSWLQKAMHGEMGYLKRQAVKRKDPRLVLDGIRSLVVLAMNYHTGGPLTQNPLKGRISRYAWGDDYHRVVKSRLSKLYEFIQRKEPQATGLFYVDTGPVMEKAWGAETSLGWLGKHSNLITREQGSWFFIGVILLNLELDYDAREVDYCGTCTQCIAACPTGAIVEPYVVDARLCISYLTIELRGPIPRALRPMIGNRIFGCDDCQETCPWNRFASASGETGFLPRAENHMADLIPLSAITQEEFETRFQGSAVRRAKRDGFVRNVVVALGNSRGPEAVPALTRALGDRSALVRAHAAWAMGRIRHEQARKTLEAARAEETERDVLEEIGLALRDLGVVE
jgi:epoxyqueuosine reductase